MNTDTYMTRRFGSQVAVRTTALMALLTLAAVAAIALTPAAAGVETRTSNLSLADLDLSTPAGVDAARDRLQQTARRWCSQVADRQDLSHQPNFIACMDETLAAALRQINGPVRAAIEEPGEWHTQQADATHSRLPPTVPETRVMIVSLANLNLSTPDGVRIAHDRIKRMARRVCRQLSGSIDPTKMWRYANCVDDAIAGALRQIRDPTVAAIDK
ncbi:MAG TPA: UrcA family protein [Steroidobacteraceae bacterium]|nr:UrcA family protein [Steroidobacteraceae bacterium]